MTYKLGSLFDGSGGFPLAGSLCGITPAWASEVEPYPIAVTRSRFPDMKHLGDISKINGAEVEPVDIITFGSPCQDLSVAGKHAGLKHEANGDDETTRSGLFMEAVRIIKEMREATNGRYPAFALWENVPGAFSSNKGEDFRIVLEELIKVVEPTAVMPPVPQSGWPYADSYCGDGWSLAYRVFDAQYWGVPQRRRRIHLVLDLRGQRAGEVLFKSEGLSGYSPQGGTPWQATAGDAESGVGADDRAGNCLTPWDVQSRRIFTIGGAWPALYGGEGGGHGYVAYSFDSLASNSMKSKNPHSGCRQVEVAKTLDTTDPNPCKNQGGIAIVEQHPVYCLQGNGIDRADTAGCNGKGWTEDKCYTLNTIDRPAVAYSVGNGQLNQMSMSETCNTLDCMHDKQAVLIEHKHPVVRYIVRRLTPTECARLQGFPDTWGHPDSKDDFTEEEYRFWLEVRNTHATINGKAVKEYTKEQMVKWYNGLHTDSAEYKLWGNGIALPPALYCLQGIADALDKFDVQTLDLAEEIQKSLGESCEFKAQIIGEDVAPRVNVIAVATQQGGAEISENGICPTITASAGMSGNNQPWICIPVAQEEPALLHEGTAVYVSNQRLNNVQRGLAEFACMVCHKKMHREQPSAIDCAWRGIDNEFCPDIIESLKEGLA